MFEKAQKQSNTFCSSVRKRSLLRSDIVTNTDRLQKDERTFKTKKITIHNVIKFLFLHLN